MRLEQSFEVPVPVAQAWGVLLDVERIAPCMPGATLTSFEGDSFTGLVRVKLGPVSLSYKGSGRFTERDESARRVSIVAQGQDSRGGGGAQARVTAVLHTAGADRTLVKVVADVDIAGKAAQFGRGMIADVSTKLVKQFADCLAQTIAAQPAAVAAPMAAAAPAAAPAAAVPMEVVAPVVPAPAPVPPVEVNAVAPPAPPPLAPVFTEPLPAAPTEPSVASAPAAEAEPAPVAEPEPAPQAAASEAAPTYTPPPATNTNPPEYHPLALQEPPADAPTDVPPPAATAVPEPEPVVKSEAEYAYAPDPAPAEPAPAPAASGPRTPPAENEPIDLLAVSGAKGMLRRAAPVLIIVGLALIGLIVWLVVA